VPRQLHSWRVASLKAATHRRRKSIRTALA
jgi:hypothetical protein